MRSPGAGSIAWRRSSVSSRERRSRGSGSWPETSSPSPGPPTARKTSSSPGRSEDREPSGLSAAVASRRRFEAEGAPGRSAGRLDQLDEHAVARSGVEERDRAFRAAARLAVDQLDTLSADRHERLGEIGDLEADVVEPLTLGREEAGDAGGAICRLDELDLGLPDRQEGDPDAIEADVHDGLELEAERLPPEAPGLLDRAHDQGDVVDLAEPTNGVWERRGRVGHRRPQIVISSRWT